MMQTSIGAHHHRSYRSIYHDIVLTEHDINILPDFAKPLPIRFRDAGYWTFNEGGKDDYNFIWSVEEFYDFEYSEDKLTPAAFLAWACLKDKPSSKPFFGQLQLKGGKLRDRASTVVDRAAVPVPPYYPDVAEVREEIAHHYDCLLKTDEEVGQVIAKLKELDLYDNTLIFLFSDHGMRLHRHKQFLYEGGIHMPCIVVGPGIKAGAIRDDLVIGIDISAASLAAARH
jgi:N-sulfoglucosamine sulfohydrolase